MLHNYIYFYIIIEFIFLIIKNQYIYSLFYMLGIFINILFNYLLKYILLIPKPNIDSSIFNLKLIQNNFSYDELGMPSLFSTLLIYSFVYFYIIYSNWWINILFLLFISIMYYYFYIIKQATILQLLVGFVIGIGTGILFIKLSKNYLKGEEKENNKNELILI